MLSGDSGQGESICTPCSVSKRLFGAGGSSSKRSLFGRAKEGETSVAGETSGDESDLGPMSPLASTDKSESSRESSPGRSFVSPLMTPEKSPRNFATQIWDRLRLNSSREKNENRADSFDALEKSARLARASPKRKPIHDSPRSALSTPRRNCSVEKISWTIGTPEREIALLFDETIIPETPRKDENIAKGGPPDDERIEETPKKSLTRRPEHRLVTPMSCLNSGEIALPRLHRRKSICPLDNNDVTRSSPEIRESNLKRRANDDIETAIAAKVSKNDENFIFAPKARASLFPETRKLDDNPAKSTIDNITLSAKKFYKRPITEPRSRSIGNFECIKNETTKKRQRMPSYTSNHKYPRRGTKRPALRRGDINAGVKHGIKRPKPKRHVSRIEAFTDKNEKTSKIPENGNDDNGTIINDESTTKNIVDTTSRESPPSPLADPNKRFFKTNRTLKSHCAATVTVSDRIKLMVTDGKIALNEKNSRPMRNPRKKARLEDIEFDATDLTVDEANFDTTTEKRDAVDGILKVLEDDWADDQYDTMETLTTILSPSRTTQTGFSTAPSQNVAMSPASVLSDMTLSMNIKDSSLVTKIPDANDPEMRLYPLFKKGYSSGITDENTSKKNNRGIKRSWQTSAKGGGAEDQYQIDAGQKRFGATMCSECGIVYQLGDPEDENAHLNYHNSVKTLKFNGWKNERVIITDPFTNSRIIVIEPGDPKQCWKKVEQVLTAVDKDLGLADMEISSYLDKKIYFYVRDKTIVGVMVAESIKIAHRMIPELADLNCCSAEDTPAKCGINVIWTAMSHRRQGIATKLLDSLRTTYYFGYIMSLEDIAFSIPTPSGRTFAEKYTKTRNFKVYN